MFAATEAVGSELGTGFAAAEPRTLGSMAAGTLALDSGERIGATALAETGGKVGGTGLSTAACRFGLTAGNGALVADAGGVEATSFAGRTGLGPTFTVVAVNGGATVATFGNPTGWGADFGRAIAGAGLKPCGR